MDLSVWKKSSGEIPIFFVRATHPHGKTKNQKKKQTPTLILAAAALRSPSRGSPPSSPATDPPPPSAPTLIRPGLIATGGREGGEEERAVGRVAAARHLHRPCLASASLDLQGREGGAREGDAWLINKRETFFSPRNQT